MFSFTINGQGVLSSELQAVIADGNPNDFISIRIEFKENVDCYYLNNEFKENKIKIATLSSTHLPFLLPFLKKYFRGVEFLDPAEDVAIKISKLEKSKSTRNSLSIYTTESPKALQRNLKSMGISNKVNLFS